MEKRKNYSRKNACYLLNRQIAVILSAFIALSCQEKKNNVALQDTGSSMQRQIKPHPDKPRDTLSYFSQEENLRIKWIFALMGEGEYGEPLTEISISVNDQIHKIGTESFAFFVIPESELKSMDLKGALTACRGWWAGQGAEYWTLKKNNEIIVMKRYIGEDLETESITSKPEKVKTIPVTK